MVANLPTKFVYYAHLDVPAIHDYRVSPYCIVWNYSADLASTGVSFNQCATVKGPRCTYVPVAPKILQELHDDIGKYLSSLTCYTRPFMFWSCNLCKLTLCTPPTLTAHVFPELSSLCVYTLVISSGQWGNFYWHSDQLWLLTGAALGLSPSPTFLANGTSLYSSRTLCLSPSWSLSLSSQVVSSHTYLFNYFLHDRICG